MRQVTEPPVQQGGRHTAAPQTMSPRTLPPQELTRPPEPRSRHDPAPSRWRYRLSRLMLTPLFRAFLRVGLPIFVVVFMTGAWFSSAENRQQLSDLIADAKTQIEQRPEFAVKLISIEGADMALMEEIRTLTGFDYPISSFDIDLEVERDKIATLPAVKSAAVRIRPGGILQVDVIQRVPVAVWRGGEGLKLIDDSGAFVADLAARADRPDLPLIVGDGARELLPEALDLYATAAPLSARLRGLVRMGERRWDVVLDRGQRIQLPSHAPQQALERIIALDQAKDLLDRDIARIDIRNPDRPTIQMNIAAADAFRLPAAQIEPEN